MNDTKIRIGIVGRKDNLIRAPEVRKLTEEEREKARETALQSGGAEYHKWEGLRMQIKPAGMIITNEAGEVETKFEGASVMFTLEDGAIYFMHVDLEKEKVIRISPPIYIQNK